MEIQKCQFLRFLCKDGLKGERQYDFIISTQNCHIQPKIHSSAKSCKLKLVKKNYLHCGPVHVFKPARSCASANRDELWVKPSEVLRERMKQSRDFAPMN